MTNFSIPGLYKYRRLNIALLDLMSDRPYLFKKDYMVTSVYGTFPNQIWNGDIPYIDNCIRTNVKDTIKLYNSRNIGIRLVYTNKLIVSSYDLKDTFCNFTLDDILSSKLNEVEVYYNTLLYYHMIDRDIPICIHLDDFDNYYDEEFPIFCRRYIIDDILRYEDLPNDIDYGMTELSINPRCPNNCIYHGKCTLAFNEGQLDFHRSQSFICTMYNRYKYEEVISGYDYRISLDPRSDIISIINTYVDVFAETGYERLVRDKLLSVILEDSNV